MRQRVVVLVSVITLLVSAPAHGRDPFSDDRDPLPTPVASAADPTSFVVPAGLYYVTDAYVGDVVTISGPTTTYSTVTVHESPGSYARVIDTVETGAISVFDGSSFNGRGALTDGRGVAGTYYENFVLTASGYVPVSIVFFQDDSESRRGAAPSPSPARSAPAATSAPPATSAAAAGEIASRGGATPAPSIRPAAPGLPPAPKLRAGVALAPDGPTLGSAEVLRGRLVHFWPRAFANDVAVPIRSWRLVSAQPDTLSAISGSHEPLVAQWIQMPDPRVSWRLSFEIFTEVAPTVRLEAQLLITVRSPALID